MCDSCDDKQIETPEFCDHGVSMLVYCVKCDTAPHQSKGEDREPNQDGWF